MQFRTIFLRGIIAAGVLKSLAVGVAEANPMRVETIKPDKFHKVYMGGFGVGNGTFKYQNFVRRSRAALGQTKFDTTMTLHRSNQWSDKVGNVLVRAHRTAGNLVQRENYAEAIEVIYDALWVIDESASGISSRVPFIKKLVRRGLEMASDVLAGAYIPQNQRHNFNGCSNLIMCPTSQSHMISVANFMFSYTQFIMDAEAEFDREWYRPFTYKYASCRSRQCSNQSGFDFFAFAKKYLVYAQRQLEYTDRLVSQMHGSLYFKGIESTYLRVAEKTASWVAYDLKCQSLFGDIASQDIHNLELLSNDLAAYNRQGDRSFFVHGHDALFNSHTLINQTIDNLVHIRRHVSFPRW